MDLEGITVVALEQAVAAVRAGRHIEAAEVPSVQIGVPIGRGAGLQRHPSRLSLIHI